jgi:hypothetical protein
MIKVMVLSLDGYNDWKVGNTSFIEVEKFTIQDITKVYFDDIEEGEEIDLEQPNPFTITYMCEEGGEIFIKQ